MKTFLLALFLTVAVLGVDLQAQSRGPRPLWERFPSRIANPDTDTSLWMQKQFQPLFYLGSHWSRTPAEVNSILRLNFYQNDHWTVFGSDFFRSMPKSQSATPFMAELQENQAVFRYRTITAMQFDPELPAVAPGYDPKTSHTMPFRPRPGDTTSAIWPFGYRHDSVGSDGIWMTLRQSKFSGSGIRVLDSISLPAATLHCGSRR